MKKAFETPPESDVHDEPSGEKMEIQLAEFVDCDKIEQHTSEKKIEVIDVLSVNKRLPPPFGENLRQLATKSALAHETFICDECGKSFISKNQCKQHLYDHKRSSSIVTCPFRNECLQDEIVGQKSLMAHLTNAHHGYTYCRKCKIYFKNAGLKEEHLAEFHPDNVEDFSPSLFAKNIFVNDDNTLRVEQMPMMPFSEREISHTLFKIGSFALIKCNDQMQPIIAYSKFTYVDQSHWPKFQRSKFSSHPHHHHRMPELFANPTLAKGFQKCHLIPFRDAPTPAQAKATMVAINYVIGPISFNTMLYKYERETRQHGMQTKKPIFITTFVSYPTQSHVMGNRHVPEYLIRCELREKTKKIQGKNFDFCAWRINCSSTQPDDIDELRISLREAEELVGVKIMAEELLSLVSE
jgi:hypothetical protein